MYIFICNYTCALYIHINGIMLMFRCIVIHGTDESVFRTFLHYLYGGHLDTGAMSLDDIIELLAVADHYETTSLRVMCEGVLVERVEDSNAFPLLQVADRYSARKLRVRSFNTHTYAHTCTCTCTQAHTHTHTHTHVHTHKNTHTGSHSRTHLKQP